MSRYDEIMQILNAKFPPTQQQRAVIESTAPGILVVAGAGSGKTATMVNRIAYNIAIKAVRPGEVLGLTFTRKAAGELSERVDRALAKLRRSGIGAEVDPRDDLDRPVIATYNSFASEIASSYGMLIGADPAARLSTDAERWQIMRDIVETWPHIGDDDPFHGSSPRSITDTALTMAAALIDNQCTTDEARAFFDLELEALDAFGEDKTRFKNAKDASAHWTQLRGGGDSLRVRRAALDIVDVYLARKRELGVVEFADQVAIAASVLRAFPALGQELAGRYRLVLLDEYQDTSINQAEFLAQALAPVLNGSGSELAGVVDSPSAGRSTFVDMEVDSHPNDECSLVDCVEALESPGGSSANSRPRSVCAVGDPRQAIYGWRGASANALADFEKEFGRRLGGIETLSLTTSFRNDEAILAAANAVAEGIEAQALTVAELKPRPNSGPGRVVEVRTLLREDSYRAIAWRIRDVMRTVAANPERDGAEIAVLCRKHSYEDLLVAAVAELDIPYEIVGGESLIERPEVLTIRAALAVVATPGRNDQLLRLLTLLGIGSSDLRALRAWSGEIAAREIAKAGSALSPRDEQSLVEAATYLPPEDWTPRHGAGLSLEGRERLAFLSDALAELRVSIHAPLADLIAQTARHFGLDLTAAVRADGAQRVRTSLDSFIALGDSFETSHPGSSLLDFLAWLDASDAREHGGEEEAGEDAIRVDEEIEVHAGVVQIMTVHAAKGLEWRDLVVVPEVVDREFSDITSNVKAWPQNSSVFPFPLRADRKYLPQFEIAECADKFEAGEAYLDFKRNQLTAYESQEARRLAYVAFTRPQAELLVAGYGLKNREEVKRLKEEGGVVPLKARSTYLEDMRARATVTPIAEVAGPNWPTELVSEVGESIALNELVATLGEETVASQGLPEIPHYEDLTDLVRWPSDVPRSFGDLAPVAGDGSPDEWEWQADVLLSERLTTDEALLAKAERPYLTATDVVHLSENSEEFLLNQRRPVPQKPSRAARLGTSMHAQIAHHFSQPATLNIDSLYDVPEFDVDMDTQREAEEQLLEAFLASPWADYPPLAIEQSMEIVVAGRIIRCTIDAVLDTSAVPGMKPVTIVDWKSGRRPSARQVDSRELQLALYRLAWARSRRMPLEDIGACFVYLREKQGRQVLQAGNLSEAEVSKRIEESFPRAS